MRKSLFKMGVVTLLMLLVAGAALADAEPKRLQVSGTAVVTGDPDIAYITVGVETQNPSAEKAAQDNASIMAQVLAALREMGLTEKEVSTSGYNIWGSTQTVNRGQTRKKRSPPTGCRTASTSLPRIWTA